MCEGPPYDDTDPKTSNEGGFRASEQGDNKEELRKAAERARRREAQGTSHRDPEKEDSEEPPQTEAPSNNTSSHEGASSTSTEGDTDVPPESAEESNASKDDTPPEAAQEEADAKTSSANEESAADAEAASSEEQPTPEPESAEENNASKDDAPEDKEPKKEPSGSSDTQKSTSGGKKTKFEDAESAADPKKKQQTSRDRSGSDADSSRKKTSDTGKKKDQNSGQSEGEKAKEKEPKQKKESQEAPDVFTAPAGLHFEPEGTLSEWWRWKEILNVQPEDTFKDVSRKYRQLMIKYHPDKNGRRTGPDADKWESAVKHFSNAFEYAEYQMQGTRKKKKLDHVDVQKYERVVRKAQEGFMREQRRRQKERDARRRGNQGDAGGARNTGTQSRTTGARTGTGPGAGSGGRRSTSGAGSSGRGSSTAGSGPRTGSAGGASSGGGARTSSRTTSGASGTRPGAGGSTRGRSRTTSGSSRTGSSGDGRRRASSTGSRSSRSSTGAGSTGRSRGPGTPPPPPGGPETPPKYARSERYRNLIKDVRQTREALAQEKATLSQKDRDALDRVARGESVTLSTEARRYKAAADAYEVKRAEYVGTKTWRAVNERKRMVEEEIQHMIERDTIFEKVKKGWRWLGDQNAEKLGWKSQRRLGKFTARMLSVRTGISVGLLGISMATGVGALVGTAAFGARRVMSGVGITFTSYDLMANARERQLLSVSEDAVKNMNARALENRMAQFEAQALLSGKNVLESEDYLLLRKYYAKEVNKADGARKVQKLDDALRKSQEQLQKEKKHRKVAAIGLGVLGALGFSGIGQKAFAESLVGHSDAGLVGDPEAIQQAFNELREGVTPVLTPEQLADVGQSADVAASVTKAAVEQKTEAVREIYEIQQDGNVWETAQEIKKALGMDDATFAKAWATTEVPLEDGTLVPLHKLNLVHAGDHLSFDADTGKFVFSNANALELPHGTGESIGSAVSAPQEVPVQEAMRYGDLSSTVLSPETSARLEEIASLRLDELRPEDLALLEPFKEASDVFYEDNMFMTVADFVEFGNANIADHDLEFASPVDMSGHTYELETDIEQEGTQSAEVVSETVSERANSILHTVFEGNEAEWHEKWKDFNAHKLLKFEYPSDIDIPVTRLQDILENIREHIGEPKTPFWGRNETVSEYLLRGLEEMQNRGINVETLGVEEITKSVGSIDELISLYLDEDLSEVLGEAYQSTPLWDSLRNTPAIGLLRKNVELMTDEESAVFRYIQGLHVDIMPRSSDETVEEFLRRALERKLESS